jgi:7-keto-8-aminopelargonate synthetase-like enzyme
MPFDAQEIFANLAEKEKIKGHHSSEGRAIRVLSRALSGWSSGNLSAGDVIVLCDQAVQDWLKARLKRSPWSAQTMPALMADAMKNGLINEMEAARLQKITNLRARSDDEAQISNVEVESALEFCIELIEKHW